MTTIQKFEDLEIWKKSRILSDKVYPLTFELTKMITSFINYLNKTKIKGQKFKNRTGNA